MREQILSEIRKLAAENAGKPPGSRVFERETGIRESAWRGVYWARWGDAVREAGLEPNAKQGKYETEFFLIKLAEACRHHGKLPTAMELRMYKRIDAKFPDVKTITEHFGSLRAVPARLAKWSKDRSEWADVAELLSGHASVPTSAVVTTASDGWVYLIKSGTHYKIGRSDNLEQRVKGIRIALPERASLIHSIRTDDPSGIEAYWHRRFADRRANGEWFALTRADLAAFKKRRYQ